MIYKVICTTTSVAETFVKARSKKEAIEIAEHNGVFAEEKEEVIDTEVTVAEVIKEHPRGQIVNTKYGYIDADKKRHRI